MNETIPYLPGLSPVAGKELCARFDGGRLSSDGGVLLFAGIERRLGIAELLASRVTDARDPASTTHSYADMIRARMFAIACGYEDCDDLDALRFDPAFKLACGRLSETGDDLMSQPTLSRLENAPSWRELGRMGLVRQANWQKVGGASPPERRSNRTTFLREPCVGSREGAGEASVAAWMGRAIEHRKSDGPGCRGFQIGRRQYRRRRFGEMSASPAVSENPCTFARLLLGPWEVFKLPRLS